jgi:hypothetical protein
VPVAIDPYLNAIRKMPSLCVGHFELVDFGPNQMRALHTKPGGRGTTYDFLLQFRNSASAHIYIYPSNVDLDYGATGQCNSDEKLRDKAIISARVESAVIRGEFRVKNGDIVALNIAPLQRDKAGNVLQGLSLDLSNVVPNSYSIYGGKISLGTMTVRMENVDEPIVEKEGSPNLEPTSARLRTQEASLAVMGGISGDQFRRQDLTFSVMPDSFIQFKIPLGKTEDVSLMNGRMLAGPFESAKDPTHLGEFNIGQAKIGYAAFNARSTLLTATEGKLQFALRKVLLDAATAQYSSTPTVRATNISSLSADSIQGMALPGPSGIDFTPDSLLRVKGKAEALQLSSGPMIVQGPANLDVARLDANGVEGTISLLSANASGLGGKSQLAAFNNLDLSGKSGGGNYQGTVSGILSMFNVGHAAVTAKAVLDGAFNKLGDLPFTVKSTEPGGLAFLVQDETGTGFEAKLPNAVLKAELSPAARTLTVAPAGLHLDASELKATAGRIIGGTPGFSQNTLEMTNPSTLTLSEKATSGFLEFTSQSFSIKDPELLDASKKYELPLTGTLLAEKPIPIRADLGTGNVFPISGTLKTSSGINLTLPNGITSVTINISGIDLELQFLKIDHFELTASVPGPDITAYASISAKGIEIGAKSVSSKENPVFSGLVSTPVKVESVSGTWKLAPFPIEFAAFEMDRADIQMASLKYSTPDGIDLAASTGSLSITKFTDKVAVGKMQLSQVAVHIDGADNNGNASAKAISLDFSGTKADPVASGQIAFDTVAFGVETGMQIDSCKSNRLPIRVSGQTGAVQGPISIAKGKTDFLLSANDLHFQLFRDASLAPWRDCEWDQTVAGVVFDYPCLDWCGGFIKYPCNLHMCRATLDIKVRWQLAVWGVQASGMLTQLKIKPDSGGKGAKMCEGHLTQLDPPLFTPTGPIAYPTIPGGNVLSEAARAGITALAASWEGPAVQSLGLLTSLVSLTHLGDRIYLFKGCDE